MTDTPWTPGPWQVDNAHHRPQITQSNNGWSGYNIAHIYAFAGPELPDRSSRTDANARLIAAAPEMAEALQMLHDNIAEYARINNLGGLDNQDMRNARAILARIKGETL